MSYFYLLCAVFFLSPALLIAQDKTLPEKALCVVCALKSGENELEKVRAHSEHEGETYYFCSGVAKKNLMQTQRVMRRQDFRARHPLWLLKRWQGRMWRWRIIEANGCCWIFGRRGVNPVSR